MPQDQWYDYEEPQKQQPPQQKWYDYEEPSSWYENVFTIPNAIRFGGSVLGSIAGGAAATTGVGALGTVPLIVGGGALGEAGARWWEGKPFDPTITGLEGVMNLLPGAKYIPGRGAGLKEIAKYGLRMGGHGAWQGAAGTFPRHQAEAGTLWSPSEWEMPSAGEFGAQTTAGAVMGTTIGTAVGAGNVKYQNRFGRPTPPPMEDLPLRTPGGPSELGYDAGGMDIHPQSVPLESPLMSGRQVQEFLGLEPGEAIRRGIISAEEVNGTRGYRLVPPDQQSLRGMEDPYAPPPETFQQPPPTESHLGEIQLNQPSPQPDVIPPPDVPPPTDVVPPPIEQLGPVPPPVAEAGAPTGTHFEPDPAAVEEARLARARVAQQAGPTPEGTVPETGILTYPNELIRNNSGLYRSLIEGGWKVINKTDLVTTFKRFFKEEKGSSEFEFWIIEWAGKKLRKLLGREPTPNEIEAEVGRLKAGGEVQVKTPDWSQRPMRQPLHGTEQIPDLAYQPDEGIASNREFAENFLPGPRVTDPTNRATINQETNVTPESRMSEITTHYPSILDEAKIIYSETDPQKIVENLARYSAEEKEIRTKFNEAQSSRLKHNIPEPPEVIAAYNRIFRLKGLAQAKYERASTRQLEGGSESEGLLRKFIRDEKGSIDLPTMWANLKKLFGRDPTPEEVDTAMARQPKPFERTGRIAEFRRTTLSDADYDRSVDIIQGTNDPNQLLEISIHWHNRSQQAHNAGKGEDADMFSQLADLAEERRQTVTDIPPQQGDPNALLRTLGGQVDPPATLEGARRLYDHWATARQRAIDAGNTQAAAAAHEKIQQLELHIRRLQGLDAYGQPVPPTVPSQIRDLVTPPPTKPKGFPWRVQDTPATQREQMILPMPMKERPPELDIPPDEPVADVSGLRQQSLFDPEQRDLFSHEDMSQMFQRQGSEIEAPVRAFEPPSRTPEPTQLELPRLSEGLLKRFLTENKAEFDWDSLKRGTRRTVDWFKEKWEKSKATPHTRISSDEWKAMASEQLTALETKLREMVGQVNKRMGEVGEQAARNEADSIRDLVNVLEASPDTPGFKEMAARLRLQHPDVFTPEQPGIKKFTKGETGAVNLPDIVAAGRQVKGMVGDAIAWPFKKGPKDEPSFVENFWSLGTAATTVGDYSMALRQGHKYILTPQWYKGVYHMIRGGWNKEHADMINAAVHSDPIFQRHTDQETGKELPSMSEKWGYNPIVDNKVSGSESDMANTWIETGGSIPYVSKFYKETYGRFARGSNRAAATFLNVVRGETIKKLAYSARAMAMEAGETGKTRVGVRDFLLRTKTRHTPEEAASLNPFYNIQMGKDIVDFVNTSSGRGPLRLQIVKGVELNVEPISKILRWGLFSQRNLASIIRTVNPNTYIFAHPYVRKQYLKAAFAAGFGWVAATQIAKLHPDVEVIDDIDSADYGKIRIGDIRIDVAAGLQQPLVVLGRLWHGGWTSSSTGTWHRFGSGYQAQTQETNMERFAVNKLNPASKMLYDIFGATEYNPFHVYDRTMQYFLPMAELDLKEIYEENPNLFPWMIGPILFGWGSQTYEKGESVGKVIEPENDRLVTGGGLKDLVPESVREWMPALYRMPWNWYDDEYEGR